MASLRWLAQTGAEFVLASPGRYPERPRLVGRQEAGRVLRVVLGQRPDHTPTNIIAVILSASSDLARAALMAMQDARCARRAGGGADGRPWQLATATGRSRGSPTACCPSRSG